MESIKSPTRKIRSQLEILLHSKKCTAQPCNVTNCGEFKSVLLHMNSCKEGRACQGVHCASSTQILKHWDTCQNYSCILCMPIRDSTKFDKYDTSDHQTFQNWMRKDDGQEQELRQRLPNEGTGFYGNGAPTENLSDTMKLSIREAVQTAMNSMMPQIETMIRSAIRTEIATIFLGQGPEKMLQNPKPYLNTAVHNPSLSSQYPVAPNEASQYTSSPTPSNQYPTTPTPSNQYPTNPNPSNQYPTNPNPSNQYPTTPNPSNQYPTTPTPSNQYPTTPTQSNQYPSTPTQSNQYPTTPTQSNHFTSPTSQATDFPPTSSSQYTTRGGAGADGDQSDQTASSMPPPKKPATGPLPPSAQQTYPLKELTMTPPSQQAALTMTPPSQQVLLPPSSSAQHQVPPSMFTSSPQNMIPSSSAHMMSGSHRRSTGTPDLHTLSPVSQRSITSPSPSLTSTTSLYSPVTSSRPLNTHQSMTSQQIPMTSQHLPMTSRQSLSSQLLAPSPQQQFSDQSGDQFMSMQSELHSYF
ncbi:hypothetical protein ACHWQZ_G001833 [Mnemiopsis leidyi]